MELELRVRLSEKPVPPGCGQRGQAAQLLAAARLYFLGQKGPDQPESPSGAPDHVLVLWHSHPPPQSCAGPGHLHVHPRQELGFPHLSSQCPAQSQAWHRAGKVSR